MTMKEGREAVVAYALVYRVVGTKTCLRTLDDEDGEGVSALCDAPPTEEQREALAGYMGSLQTRDEAAALVESLCVYEEYLSR
jgi:hypothetical protein